MKNIIILAALCLLMMGMHPQVALAQEVIDKVEYFWDVDPGLGNGTQVDIVDGAIFTGAITVDPTSLAAGLHILYVRSHTDDGIWGIPISKKLFIHEIEAAEYFWNNDPGVGNGTPIPFTTTATSINESLTLSTVGFRPGPARLGVRWKLKGGSWGPTTYKQVNVATEFVEGEYFWNTDPGIGNATSFALPNDQNYSDADIEINSFGLDAGYHDLYIRTRGLNGSFGITKKKRLYIARKISGGEYFWDTDPGVGNGNPLTAIVTGTSAQICNDIPTTAMSDGEHYLYVRSVTEDGVWSVPSRLQITITPSDVVVGCPGDLTRDGVINTGDLVVLLGFFGQSGECSADITGDLEVNSADLVVLLGVFGTSCE